MIKGNFGENLKREREMRGVSLEEISAATRIATRFLRAIESEQWEQLPGGVFNRGFVRAVARYLGLDEENIVAEYALVVDDRPSVPVWTGRPPVVVPDRPWLGWIFGVAVIVGLLVGGLFATRRVLAWIAAKRAAHGVAISVAVVPEPPEMPRVTIMPAAVSSEPTADPAPGPAAAPIAAPVSRDSAPAAPPPPAGPVLLVLKVEAEKKTKVTIDADSDQLFDGTMQAGENQVYSAKDRFDVSARDAGALLLELNGKTLPPMGPPGKAGKVALTREALKGAAGGED